MRASSAPFKPAEHEDVAAVGPFVRNGKHVVPPANAALRASPESCAKLKPSNLFDVE